MDNNQDLTITIKAKTDDAIAPIKKVREEVKATTDTMKKAGAASESMAASVFKATAAYDILKTGLRTATSFFSSAIQESAHASAIMAQIETNVTNAGFAYDKLSPKLKEYGDSAMKLGFDDDEAAKSLSRLLVVTKDYEQARALANLAMDLAANKNISLDDATKGVLMVTQGNTKALREYGIGLDDTATTAQVLLEAQNKLKDSALNFSKTTAGQMQIVRNEFNDMKKEIGNELAPTLLEFFAEFKKHIPEIKALVMGLVNTIEVVAGAIGKVIKAAEELGSVLGTGLTTEQVDANKAMTDAKIKADDLAVAYNKVHKGTVITGDAFLGAKVNMDLLREATKAYTDQNKQVSSGGKNPIESIKNVVSGSTDAINTLKEKYKDWKDALIKTRQSAVDELESIRKAHEDSVDQSRQKISDLTKSLSDLTYSYNRSAAAAQKAFESQKTSDRMGIASEIVAQQQKINELRNQYDTEQDPNKKIGIKEQLDKEVAAYESTAQLRIDLSNEISATLARNSMTDLERAVADYTERRKQADQEYADNRADAEREYNAKAAEIKLELAQTKDKLKKENDEYIAKRELIKKYLNEAEAQRLDTTLKTSKAIMAQIDKEIEKYNQLANAIARASQGKSTPINMQGLASHEHGGTVEGPVGRPVPIIAHGGETIIPAGQSAGMDAGLSVSIIMNYPKFTNKDEQQMVKDQIDLALRDVIRNYKIQQA